MSYALKCWKTWPRKRNSSRFSAFKATYSSTLEILDRELIFLKASTAVVQLNLPNVEDEDVQRLRESARANFPGVILSFQSKHGPLQYLCDRFHKWQDNLRAIALTLERLRLSELYGVAASGEQYQGWAQLPAPEPTDFATPYEASRWIVQTTQWIGNEDLFLHADGIAQRECLRLAILKCHPDQGGSSALFKRLTKAREKLGI